MAAPLVLDTNAFRTKGFLHWLRTYHGPKLLPAVAYAELGLFIRHRGTQEAYDGMLAEHGIDVEWLDRERARTSIELALVHGDWDRNSRDYLIGAHAASPPRLLVTNNLKDFTFLGDRVRTPAQLMAAPPR